MYFFQNHFFLSVQLILHFAPKLVWLNKPVEHNQYSSFLYEEFHHSFHWYLVRFSKILITIGAPMSEVKILIGKFPFGKSCDNQENNNMEKIPVNTTKL